MSITELDAANAAQAAKHANTQTNPHANQRGATVTTINPWSWQDALGFAQGTLVENARRTVHVAGQCSINAQGIPVHAGDMAAQAALVMDNVETVLAQAGMGLADVVRYDVYTTDMQEYFAHGVAEVAGRFARSGRVPTGGIAAQVVALAMPPLMLEVVVTASR